MPETGVGGFFGGRAVVEGDSRASDAEYARCNGPMGVEIPVVDAGVGSGCNCLLLVTAGWLETEFEGSRSVAFSITGTLSVSRDLMGGRASFGRVGGCGLTVGRGGGREWGLELELKLELE